MNVDDALFDKLDRILINTEDGGSNYANVLKKRLNCGITYSRHAPSNRPGEYAYYIKMQVNRIELFHFSLTANQWPQTHFLDTQTGNYWFYDFDEAKKELRLDTTQHRRGDVPGDIRIAAILIDEILTAAS